MSLPAIFSDHMVVQAGRETACWGKGKVGDSIAVEFLDTQGVSKARASAQVGSDGHWMLRLPALAVGEQGKLTVSASGGEKREIQDVIVGEIWLAAGQSNMKFSVGDNVKADQELALASRPQIRLFQVEQRVAASPLDDVHGKWQVADAASVKGFSAMAWFFGTILQTELKMPVGLVQATWGGTTIATWLPPSVAQSFLELKELEETYQKAVVSHAKFKEKLTAWQAANPTAESQKANAASKPKGARPARIENTPSQCFNAMVYGVMPYTLRGILWYQGESDAARAPLYKKLFPALISSWREGFANPDLPFLYVELPGYNPTPNPIPDGWAWIRESQAAGLALPKVNVAAGIDLGSTSNVLHPKNKKALANRLAQLALGEVYGRGGLVKSPQFAGIAIEGSKARIRLENAAGLRMRGPELEGFQIKSADGQWKPGEARIEGVEIVVESAVAPSPVAVRYAWSGSPPASVENASGLPLRPFRTDSDPPPGAKSAADQSSED